MSIASIAITPTSGLLLPVGHTPESYSRWVERITDQDIELYGFDGDPLADPSLSEDSNILRECDGLLIAGSGLISLITAERIVAATTQEKPVFTEIPLAKLYRDAREEYSPIRYSMLRATLRHVENVVVKTDATKIRKRLEN